MKVILKKLSCHFIVAFIVLLFLAAGSSQAEYWGSIKSNKYHHPSCPHAQRIKPDNLIKFATPVEATNRRYIPCKVCNPPFPDKDTNVPPQEILPSAQMNTPDQGICTRVVDGDTIVVKLNGQEEKVRLIGVDTPETVHPSKPVEYFGKEASRFTRQMVEGRRVTLEYDWQRRDKYGRLLAYVFLENQTMLNEEIVKQGYGFAYTRFPFKYLEKFRGLEREARENNRGLWGKK
jgi:micrococcal nuclease